MDSDHKAKAKYQIKCFKMNSKKRNAKSCS